eukprot:c16651_g1_i1 orf=365-844(-)
MNQIAALVEEVFAGIRSQWRRAYAGKNSFTEPVLTFVHAVDWKEPWLIMLLVFHTALLTVAIRTRKRNNIQMGIFFFSLFCVHIAERLNSVLVQRWTLFAQRPYFDHHGVFISIVWSAPILFIASVILVNSLLTLVALIIKWKKTELRHRAHMACHKAE